MDSTRASLLSDAAPDLLRKRTRLIFLICTGGLTVFAIGDLVVNPDTIATLWLLKAPLYVTYGLLLWLLPRTRTERQIIALGLLSVVAGVAGTAISGMVTGDVVSTQMLCMMGMLVTALAVPWGGSAQAVASAIATAGIAANTIVVGEFDYPLFAALAAMGASVLIADRLARSHQGELSLRRELEQSERFLREITDNLPALIAYVDTEERYRFVNRAQAHWTRLSRDEILGRKVADIASPEMYAVLAPLLHRALSGRRTELQIEAPSPQDEVRSLDGLLEPNRDENGSVHGLFCLLNDVTDRKQAERAARQQQAELAHLLRVHTMGEMAAAFAHELNQPLAAIAAYAASCATRAESLGTSGSEISRSANRVAAEALRAGEIIRRLQRLVRKVEPHWEHVEPRALIERARALVQSEAANAGIQIDIECEADLPALHADAIQLEQVFVNLLLNAVQAIERGRGGQAHVRVRVGTNGGHVRFTFVDQGPGIAAEMRGKLFEPYETTKEHGLGMGLAISRSIIQSHEGRIWNEEHARETTFVVELPVDATAASEAEASEYDGSL